MRAEYRTIKAQLEAYQTELTTKRTTLSSLEKDHHASLEVLLKKEEDHARVREECSVLEARLQSAKNELAQAEASMFELQSSERTAKVGDEPVRSVRIVGLHF